MHLKQELNEAEQQKDIRFDHTETQGKHATRDEKLSHNTKQY
jgi:hypothetical protein